MNRHPTPIVLFAYNRPWYLWQTIAVLKQNHLAENRQPFVCSDGPRNEHDKDLVQEEVVRRRAKAGSNTPIVDWMQFPLKGYSLDHIASADFRKCGLVDRAETQENVWRITRSGRGEVFCQGAIPR